MLHKSCCVCIKQNSKLKKVAQSYTAQNSVTSKFPSLVQSKGY